MDFSFPTLHCPLSLTNIFCALLCCSLAVARRRKWISRATRKLHWIRTIFHWSRFLPGRLYLQLARVCVSLPTHSIAIILLLSSPTDTIRHREENTHSMWHRSIVSSALTECIRKCNKQRCRAVSLHSVFYSLLAGWLAVQSRSHLPSSTLAGFIFYIFIFTTMIHPQPQQQPPPPYLLLTSAASRFDRSIDDDANL